MKKSILPILTIMLMAANCFGHATSIYHERTTNAPGGTCGTYVSNLNPSPGEAVTIEFTIDQHFFTNRACIYYTTDGSNPVGSYGNAYGNTSTIMASYFCTYDNGSGAIIDVVKATLPAVPYGTIMKYIVSAWHTVKGPEVFGSPADTTAGSAIIYSYGTALNPLQVTNLNFTAKKINNTARLTWVSSQEINMANYEVYHSTDGVQFAKTATKLAAGNTTTNTSYTMDDNNVAKGNNFYKIKSIDKDGHFFYTNVIKIVFDDKGSVSIKEKGNNLYIQLSAMPKDVYTVRLSNNTGQLVKTYTIYHDGNNEDHTVQLPMGLLPNVYHVSVSSTKNIYTQSIFKQ